jgi:predicted 3-demethylubiquinone-9 3-methyltransferase (glyoxalase superfamily)
VLRRTNGWVQDKYGLSWQLIYTNPEGEERPLKVA